MGNTLEALAAGYLVQRFGGGERVFDDAAGVVRFAVIAVSATVISAAFGTAGLALGDYVQAYRLPHVALTWWLGDLAGALVVTPVVVLWGRNLARLQLAADVSLVLPYLGAVIVGLVAFAPWLPPLPIRALRTLWVLGHEWGSLKEPRSKRPGL